MSLKQAFQAFFKAWREPEEAKKFLADSPQQIEAPQDSMHLRLLSYLQQAGRLVDFLKEDITQFSDAQVGAAVRKVHQDCNKLLEELVTIRPLRSEQEGSTLQIPKGYDPNEVKVVGQIKGEPPYTGILVHKGWKAHKRSLPKKTSRDSHCDIIHPAEVEVK
jgi:hypothetical protein